MLKLHVTKTFKAKISENRCSLTTKNLRPYSEKVKVYVKIIGLGLGVCSSLEVVCSETN